MFNRKYILFVDDELDFLNGLKRMLYDQEEWDLHFVTSVDEALYRINQIAIDTNVIELAAGAYDLDDETITATDYVLFNRYGIGVTIQGSTNNKSVVIISHGFSPQICFYNSNMKLFHLLPSLL